MASYTWNGSTGSYLDPTQWTPTDVPLYGSDTVAAINAGTVTLNGAEPNGIMLLLSQSTNPATASRLVLSNAALGPDMTLGTSGYTVLEVDGYATNFGTIALGDPGPSADLEIDSKSFGQLNQYGTMMIGPSTSVSLSTQTRLNNDGWIELAGGYANVYDTITGNGTIDLASTRSSITVTAGVEAGQTFMLHQGTLEIDDYSGFQGTLAGFNDSAALVGLRDLQFDAATYTQDGSGEHVVLTDNGVTVGELQLAGTPYTQYTVTKPDASLPKILIRPTTVYSDGSIPASITGDVTIRDAEPDGQTVALGTVSLAVQNDGPNLVLDNAALGPDFLLTVSAPDTTGSQIATLTVQGYDTNYGEIDVIPSVDQQTTRRGNTLTINMQPGSQLNQEGTIKVVSPQTSPGFTSNLIFSGTGTVNNDGQILIEQGSVANINQKTIGSGTIVVNHGTLSLFDVASTQTIDFLGGTINASTSTFNATIKDWNGEGAITLSSFVTAVQFNQTSTSEGDLQLFAGTTQVGALHLLGSYATSDFTVIQAYHEVDIVASGKHA